VRCDNAAQIRHFLDYWRTTRELLDAQFVDWIPRFFPELPASQTAAIYHELEGGKRIRGCLVCLVSDALGGRLEDAIPRAVAIECIQAASLIHDDVVDGDLLRRGRPATWTTQGSRKAVLLGDFIFATALQRMVEISREDGLAAAQAIATMASGAYQEPLEPAELDGSALMDERQGRELYPRIIYLKTGVLFGTAARLGAFAAGAPSAMAALAFELGVQIGEAYQIADDLHDLDPGTEGPISQLSLLVPALLHFCSDTCPRPEVLLDRDNDELYRRMIDEAYPLLRQRMHEAMALRLRRAVSAARRLSSNGYSPVLEAAPEQIVGMMLPS
jgi:hypothetical protein